MQAIKRLSISIVIGISIVGCGSNPGGAVVAEIIPEHKQAIALCGGGIKSSTRIAMEGIITENGGKITSSIEDELVGILVSKSSLSQESAVKFLAQWHKCIDRELTRIEKKTIK